MNMENYIYGNCSSINLAIKGVLCPYKTPGVREDLWKVNFMSVTYNILMISMLCICCCPQPISRVENGDTFLDQS
jgi:hypothetical protein